MPNAIITGTGHFVPERVVTNDDLAKMMTTTDEWIQQRTGIKERRFVDFENDPMGSSELGARAGKQALEAAGLAAADVDCIIYATLSPDRAFPGDGVLVQAKLDIPAGVPAFDVRNQCSGFLYGLQMAHAFIGQGLYKNVLLIGAETHSSGLDFSDRGRDVAVIFGDGGAAAVLSATDDPNKGVLDVQVRADGRYADILKTDYPTSTQMPRIRFDEYPDPETVYPSMQGRQVFKHASTRMPEIILEVLEKNGLSPSDIGLLIPHQANLRISEMVQKKLALSNDQVFNNIQKYGNTTACSIPLALDEAVRSGLVKSGDLVCLAAFGAGFTWGASLIRWA